MASLLQTRMRAVITGIVCAHEQVLCHIPTSRGHLTRKKIKGQQRRQRARKFISPLFVRRPGMQVPALTPQNLQNPRRGPISTHHSPVTHTRANRKAGRFLRKNRSVASGRPDHTHGQCPWGRSLTVSCSSNPNPLPSPQAPRAFFIYPGLCQADVN